MEILKRVFGMTTMGFMILIFGVSIGVATFIENDFGTPAAKAVVYNAVWFETLMGLLTVNMIVVIFTYKMYRKEKIVNLIFHLAFILVLIGAAITRFIGFEGVMHIREGESSNTFLSESAYVSVWIETPDGEDIESDEKVLFNNLTGAQYKNSFQTSTKKISVKTTSITANAKHELVDDPSAGPVIELVTAGEGGRVNKYLKPGDTQNVGGILMSYNDTTVAGFVHIVESDSGLIVRFPVEAGYMKMADQSRGQLAPGIWHNFSQRQLYVVGNANFVFSDYRPNARLTFVADEKGNEGLADIVTFEITDGDETKTVSVSGDRGLAQKESSVTVGDHTVHVAYGSMLLQLPFHIALEDFQLERYPGSDSPSSYASEVVLKDASQGVEMPFRIYMNHILEHRGFRFYQSSYDQDEKGTVLSVNHDYWGTFVTYWGYFFLFAGLLAIFVSGNTRFAKLSKMIDQIHKKREKMVAVLFFMVLAFAGKAQETPESLPPTPISAHAEKFGSVLVQTQDGRITPINTIGNEILRKVVKKSNYKGLNSDQVFLGMISRPQEWRNEKMIRVNHKDLYPLLEIDDKYASFLDFFTHEGEYKIEELVNEAFAKKPAERGTLDKEVIALDERVNICYMTYFGSFLKMFPIPGHPDNKWTTPVEPLNGVDRSDSLFIAGVVPFYLESLHGSMENGDYGNSDQIVASIKKYQAKFGAEVMPSQTKINLELAYNKINIFERLYPYYMLVGFVFLILLYIRLLNPKVKLKWGLLLMQWIIMAAFIVHAVGLGSRWYISGHEPWSNGYESMLYIAWAGLLAGLIFRKKSPITMAVTAILAGIILFVAHLSWMDPEITNLVPVLKSYWLTIHVATITASYGFLALGALLAFVNLATMIMRRDNNSLRLNLTIKEVTYVIEMTVTVGLVLLTIGNFLGGIWANESWGRYWGWDPKETWAMATIIFYAFVLHMRFIPGLRGPFPFNFAALITFSAVIMTYFGVNYYLSGLHSYAKGDPVPIPDFVYYTLAIIGIVSLIAFIAELKDKQRMKKNLTGKADKETIELLNEGFEKESV